MPKAIKVRAQPRARALLTIAGSHNIHCLTAVALILVAGLACSPLLHRRPPARCLARPLTPAAVVPRREITRS
jgi:hypothetical protein